MVLDGGTPRCASCSGNRGSWYPKDASKGDNPVAKEVSVLCVYSAQGRNKDQDAESWVGMQRRVASSS